jgi:hemerythrin-like domain-containing protein
MDAITLLGRDHDEMLALLAGIEQDETSQEPAAPQRRQRCKDVANRLMITQSWHGSAENQYLWPLVRCAVPAGVGLVSRAQGQHATSLHVMGRLERTSVDEPAFDHLLDAVVRDVRAHIEYERDVVWPMIRAAVSQEQLDQLGDRMSRAGESILPARTM